MKQKNDSVQAILNFGLNLTGKIYKGRTYTKMNTNIVTNSKTLQISGSINNYNFTNFLWRAKRNL